MVPAHTLGIAARRERTAAPDPTTTPRKNDYTAALTGLYLRPGAVPNSAIPARINSRSNGVHQARRAVPEPLHANPGTTNPGRTIAGPLRPAPSSNLGWRADSPPTPSAANPLTPAEAAVSAALPAPGYIPLRPPPSPPGAITARGNQQSIITAAQSKLQREGKKAAQKAIAIDRILDNKRSGHIIVLANESESLPVSHQYLAANKDYLLANLDKFVFLSDSLPIRHSEACLHEQRNFLPDFLVEHRDRVDFQGMDASHGAQLGNRFALPIVRLTELRKEVESDIRKLGGDSHASPEYVARLQKRLIKLWRDIGRDISSGRLTGPAEKEAKKLLKYADRTIDATLRNTPLTLFDVRTAIDGPKGAVTGLRNVITEARRMDNTTLSDPQTIADRIKRFSDSGKTVIYLTDPQKIFDFELANKQNGQRATREGFLGHLVEATNGNCTPLTFSQSSQERFAYREIEMGRIIRGEEYSGISSTKAISVPGNLFIESKVQNAPGSPDGRSQYSESGEDSE